MTPLRSSPLSPLVGVTEVTSTDDQIDSFPSAASSARRTPCHPQNALAEGKVDLLLHPKLPKLMAFSSS